MNLNEYRSFVLNRQRAADQKINRLRRKGIDLTGTKHDVRRDKAKIAKYNRPQLEAYARKLNGFVERSNSFELGAQGVILPGAKLRELREVQSRLNRKVDRKMKSIGDVILPTLGKTINERDEEVRSKRLRASGEATNRPLQRSQIRAANIASVEAMDKLIAGMKTKLDRGYEPKRLSKSREEMDRMLEVIGNEDLRAQMTYMSDKQFDLFWNYDDSAGDVSMMYEIAKMRAAGRKDAAHDSQMEDALVDIQSRIDWAHEGRTKASVQAETKASANTTRKRRK